MSQSKQLAHPLQGLLALAAKSIPKETGETSNFKARIDSAGRGVAIVCDLSGSMDERAGGRTKIEILRDSLAQVLVDLADFRLIGFGSVACQYPSPYDLPEPSGGTALHLAIDLAASLDPARTLILSDGQPDEESLALASADRLGGRIDCIFCGPDSDVAGKAFLARLARIGAGTFVNCDLARSSSMRFAIATRAALGLPAPKGS